MEISMHTAVFKDGDENIIDEQVLFAEDIAGEENEVINLYPEMAYETFEGFAAPLQMRRICLCSDE